MRATLLALALMALAACAGPDRADFDSDAAFAAAAEEHQAARQARLERIERVSAAGLAFARTQIEAYRSLGVDLALLQPQHQALATAACATLIGAVEAGRAFVESDPAVEETADAVSADALQWCLLAVETAGPSTAPATMLPPPPKP